MLLMIARCTNIDRYIRFLGGNACLQSREDRQWSGPSSPDEKEGGMFFVPMYEAGYSCMGARVGGSYDAWMTL